MAAIVVVLALATHAGFARAEGLVQKFVANFAGEVRIEADTPTGHFSMRQKGTAEFTDTEDDVRPLNGTLRIEEKADGHTRLIEFASNGAQAISRVYSVDGKQRPFDADGKRWLGGLLPNVMREGAIAVPSRVTRILAKGGPDAVLTEIEKIHSDFARRVYIVELSGRGPLDERRLGRLIADVSMSSDFERRIALQGIHAKQKLAPAEQAAFFKMIGQMQSDFEKRVLLQAVLSDQKLAPEAVVQLLNVAAKLQSDFEKRVLLSDVLSRQTLGSQEEVLFLKVTSQMQSDFEKRLLLTAFAARLKPGTASVAAYLDNVKRINSDFEKRVTLVGLLDAIRLAPSDYPAAIDTAGSMSSDFEKRLSLVAIARHMPADDALLRQYRKVARPMGDFERGQAEKALDHLQ